MQSLISDLRSFKLSGMAFCLEERLIYAQTKTNKSPAADKRSALATLTPTNTTEA